MKRSIGLANTVSTTANASVLKKTLKRSIEDTVDRCRVQRKSARALETTKDLSDEAMCRAAKWTDRLPLRDYDNMLHLCPRLVNVVTVSAARDQTKRAPPTNQSPHRACRQLAEAIPVAGSGLKLPLDLHTIGARCSNAYYAPRRFAAVQLAFDAPRCRVLVFRALHKLEPFRTHAHTDARASQHARHNAFKTNLHLPTCASQLSAQIPAGLSELVRLPSHCCTCPF